MSRLTVVRPYHPVHSPLQSDGFDVAVVVFTYNHSRFISRCLKSILAQEFSGRVGVFIHDDCSTDDTAEVARRTVEEHVNTNIDSYLLIRPYNGRSIGDVANWTIFNKLKCKYVALCEGDDAWGDRCKLQKQYDFMESNPAYSVCVHEATTVNDCGEVVCNTRLPDNENMRRDFSRAELQTCSCYLLTNTLFMRGKIEFPARLGAVSQGDNVIWSTLGHHGACKFLSSVGNSLFTVHEGGAWSQRSDVERAILHSETWLRMGRYYYEEGKVSLAAAFMLKARSMLERLRFG